LLQTELDVSRIVIGIKLFQNRSCHTLDLSTSKKNGGWPEMHQGSKHSAFKGAYWKAYRGDRLHNWFIARADVANFTKSDIILNGILNVHYFNSTQAAVYWHNSYQLR